MELMLNNTTVIIIFYTSINIIVIKNIGSKNDKD